MRKTLSARHSIRLSGLIVAAVTMLLSSVGMPVQILAQAPSRTPDAMEFSFPYEESSGAAAYAGLEDDGVGGYGIKGRLGHEAGDTVGREGSLSFLDLSPYLFLDNTLLFGEGRLFITNEGRAGGSAGGGLRHFFPGLNTVAGASFFYDGDDSRSAMFKQFGVSGEIFTEWLDWRGNFYFPFGDKQKVTGTALEAGSQEFIDAIDGLGGSNLQFQRRTFLATTMTGFDMMFTVPVPSELAQRFNVEASAGFYHFRPDQDGMDDVWGWKLRGDADVFDRLSHLFLEVMHDDVFKTNVVFGIDVNYWNNLESRPRIGRSQYNRIAQWVRRNRTVSTMDSSYLTSELARKPGTSDPYRIYHVSNVPGGPVIGTPDGSLDNPFDNIQEAVDRNPLTDIVFVHGNSVFDGAGSNVDLTGRGPIQIIGEDPGVPLTIPVAGLGQEIPLPTITEGPFDRPIIQNVTGPAVVMENNTRFGGIDISNVLDGPAFRFNGIPTGASLQNVDITNVTGSNAYGLEFVDNTGAFTLTNINMTGVEDSSILVQGGTAQIQFAGVNSINDTQGLSLEVLDAGGFLNMRGTEIINNGGNGIRIGGSAPGSSTVNVTLETVNLQNTNAGAAAEAVLINNHSGNVFFTNALTIDNNNGDAFVVSNLGGTGNVTALGTTTINNRAGRGIYVQNMLEEADPLNPSNFRAGLVEFQGNVVMNGLADGYTGTDAGIKFDSPSGTLVFRNNVSINGSNGMGVDISNIASTGVTTGSFQSQGTMSINETVGTAFNVDSIAKRNFLVRTMGLDIDERSAVGLNISNYAGSAQILGNTIVGNNNNSDSTAITVLDNTGSINFGSVLVDDAIGAAGTTSGVHVEGNVNRLAGGGLNTESPASVSFASLSVNGTGGTGVSMIDNQSVSTSAGELEIANGSAIVVDHDLDGLATVTEQDGRHNLTFNSISASGGDYGIYVNGPGSFVVNGNPSRVIGSGGTISGQTIAGAYFANTQRVQLGFMELVGNQIGVHAVNINDDLFGVTPELTLQGVEIDGSVQQGILGQDVINFALLDSIVSGNGRGTAGNNHEQILLTVSQTRVDSNRDGRVNNSDDLLSFRYVFDNNTIEDTGAVLEGDMISIVALPVVTTAVNLELAVTNNGVPGTVSSGISSHRANGAALNVNWEGDVAAYINNNSFELGGDGGSSATNTNQIGIRMDVDGQGIVEYSNNSLTAQSNGATGLRFDFDERADIRILNNVLRDDNGNFIPNSGFVFSGQNSTAMDFTLRAPNNNIVINTNDIRFLTAANDGTGIFFRRIFGPSSVSINQNLIQLSPDVINGSQERGIFFQDVRGVIQLFGNQNNLIGPDIFPGNQFISPFYIPDNVSTGTIIVNGVSVP